MWFLYGELLALIVGSFLVGCVVTRIGVRLVVPATPPAGTDIPASEPGSDTGSFVTSSGVVG